MNALAPLAVVIPLLVAALQTAIAATSFRKLRDTTTILTAVAVAVLCWCLFVASRDARIIYWFGGWKPRGGTAIGIAFAIDPLGAGIALLAAVLTTASLIYSWWYFKTIGSLYSTLMLAFLAGMVGFALTGDLFNMFVFFELMGAAAYALTGYKIEEEPALMGAFSFAVTNTIGAFLVLIGLGLLYGRTGALNLAQIGRALDGGPADGLVIVAFVLIASGFAVKAAVVPLHFWLDDAHAVAPTPVCVLFSGVMVELGLYAIARVYWTIFGGVFEPNREMIRAIGVAAATATVLVGGLMAFCQCHFKRLLAFSTISHVGIFLLGMALLSPLGLAGAALAICGHGLVKGALFLGAGILLNRFESVDTHRLRGRGKRLPMLGALLTIAGLALCGLPFLGMNRGEGLIVRAAENVHYGAISLVMLVGSILTGGAVLRAVGEVFFGFGAEERPATKTPSHEEKEVEEKFVRPPLVMLAPIGGLLAIAIAASAVGSVEGVVRHAAQTFVDHAGYAAAVLDGAPSVAAIDSLRRSGQAHFAHPGAPGQNDSVPDSGSIWHGMIATCGAVLLAALALLRGRTANAIRRAANLFLSPILRPLRALHSGHIGDYVAWLLFGVASFGGLMAVLLRR